MLALLPAFAFLVTLLALRRRLHSQSWREASLVTAVVFGALLVLVTEGLSLFHVVNAAAVIVVWTALTALAAGWWWFDRNRPSAVAAPPAQAAPSLAVRLLLGGMAVYLGTTFVIAVVAPPNTWDVMEYHLPKVMHWIQNGGIGFYPTAIPRQNHLAPGSEFAVLHLHLLTGSDRFTNLVAWFSMVGGAIGVSLIARQLGASAMGQTVAAVFTVTLPMGIMQATSAQTDYVVAFWFVCFLHFLLRLLFAESFSWPGLLVLAAALGLAVFTKATAYLMAPPFLLWMAIALVRRLRLRVWAPFAAITAVFLVLNLGHYVRNTQVYHHPLGPREEPTPNSRYALESHAPNAVLSSFAKHVGTHLNSPWPAFNAALQRKFVAFHQRIGWGLDDPRTSFGPAFARFRVALTDYQDETAGNPLHFIAGTLCFALVLAVPALRRDRRLLIYTIAVGTSFLLFPLYLKWHPWMSRLHLGVFIAAAPVVAVALTRLARGLPGAVVAGLLLLLSLPWLLFCQERPLVGRETIFNTPRDRLYFKTPHQRYADAYLAAPEFFRSHPATQVGLVTGNSSWEYMFWYLVRRERPAVRIEHVNVRDASATLQSQPPFREFQPEVIVTLDQRRLPERLVVGDRTFARQWRQGAVEIFVAIP